MNILIFQIVQVVLSVLIIGLVMVQDKGKGLSTSVSSGIPFYGSRRGLEKVIFGLTIVAGIFLVVNSLIILFLS